MKTKHMKKSESPSPRRRPDSDSLSAPILSRSLEKTQITKYHTKGGHGFAAEDANNLADRLKGKHARIVGMSNEKNGADRLVDGIQVQSKYFQSAAETVAAAFNQDTGIYRYPGKVLEVPKDQYAACLELMRDRIKNGCVPGIDNPTHAEKLIRQGTVTYNQARNIARAGSVDSLVFDMKTQAISCTYVFAISFAIDFARSKWHGDHRKDAIKTALFSSFSTGSKSLFTGIVSAQVLRTRTAAFGAIGVRRGIRALSRTTIGRGIVHRVAAGSTGNAVFGGAAINHVARLLRTNVVAGAVTVVATSVPDFYRAVFDGSISFRQLLKNVSVTVVGVAGGIGGYAAGMAVGAAVGSVIPVIGTGIGGIVGGILGGGAGGYASSSLGKNLADRLAEDDTTNLISVLNEELPVLASEYLLSEEEIELLISETSSMIDAKWLRQMFRNTNKSPNDENVRQYIRSEFEPVIDDIVRKRPKIAMPQDEQVEYEISMIVEKAVTLGADGFEPDGTS